MRPSCLSAQHLACLPYCSMLGIKGACMLLTLLRLHETMLAANSHELRRLGERGAGCQRAPGRT